MAEQGDDYDRHRLDRNTRNLVRSGSKQSSPAQSSPVQSIPVHSSTEGCKKYLPPPPGLPPSGCQSVFPRCHQAAFQGSHTQTRTFCCSSFRAHRRVPAWLRNGRYGTVRRCGGAVLSLMRNPMLEVVVPRFGVWVPFRIKRVQGSRRHSLYVSPESGRGADSESAV